MKTIREHIEVSAGQEELFDLTQDYGRRLEWDSYLVEARLLHGAGHADVDVESYCKNRSGSVMISKYISFNRPKVAAIKMIKGPWILRSFSGAWNVRSISEAQSELIFTYNFELKGGFLGRLLQPIAIFVFRSDMRKRLEAIKLYLDGEIVHCGGT